MSGYLARLGTVRKASLLSATLSLLACTVLGRPAHRYLLAHTDYETHSVDFVVQFRATCIIEY